MGDSFEESLAQAAPAWVEEGIITSEQAKAILERHDARAYVAAGSSSTRDWVSPLLYGTAGILLGAAALVLILVGLEPSDASLPFLVASLTLAIVGVALDQALPQRRLLGEAFLAGSLVPLAASVIDEGTGLGLLLVVAVTGALIVWKREQPFLPTFSVIAYAVGTSAGLFELVNEDAVAATLWLGAMVALCVGVVLVDRLLRSEDGGAHVALATAGLAIGAIPFLVETVDIEDSVNVELAVGGLMVIALAAGILLRHRGVVLGAATALTIDAIVFAFDVGGVWLGTLVLLGLAGLMIWQAETLKTYMAKTG